MEYQWLILFLLSPLPIMAAVALYSWQQRVLLGARLLLALMLAGSLATVAYAGDLLSATLEVKLFWLQFWYLGIVLLTPLLLLLALWQRQCLRWLTPHRMGLIFVPAALVLLSFYTNGWHHQFYAGHGLDSSGAIPMRISVRGPFYWTTQFVVSMYLLGAVYALAVGWRNEEPPYSTQAAILLLATVAPVVGNVLHLLRINAFGYVNLTSISLMVTGLTYAWGISRYRMFDLVPVVHQTILQHMRSGVVVVDRRGRILEINPAACAIFATTRQQAIGAPLAEIFAPWSTLGMADGTPGDREREVIVGAPDTPRALLVTAEPLPAANLPPEAAHTVLLIQDVTARRDAERASLAQQRQLAVLEERERMARDLHDGVGQVLGYVSTQTQAVRAYLASDQCQMADATLAHLVAVTQDAHADLRNFILGAQPGAAGPVRLATALAQLVEHFEANYGQAVSLVQAGEPDAAWLGPAAQTQILYVVQEALTNIRKHAAANSATVYSRISADAVEIAVEDDGVGFDRQAVDGQHFGLQIMQARMAELGGELTVVAAPGRGTEIVARVWRPAGNADAHDVLSGLRVLLVDDQPLFRDGLHNLLTARGIEVAGMAANGAEAVQKARELRPDIVIMDINMPVLDGLSATEQIKQAMPDVKVLVLTIAETDTTLLEALRRGASGYLLKNLDAQTLFTMLERLQAGETVLTATMATHLVDQFARGHGPDDFTLNERQQAILHLMAQGYTYREIGAKVHLSESAVKYNAGQILDRLHARTRAEAVRVAEKRGLV